MKSKTKIIPWREQNLANYGNPIHKGSRKHRDKPATTGTPGTKIKMSDGTVYEVASGGNWVRVACGRAW